MTQKIRYKKIRGKNRILRNIRHWTECHRHLDLENLQHAGRDYVKFWVKPFCNLNITNSRYPEPTDEIKEELLQGLLTIYQNWKIQLDTLNKPYYLKIWPFQNQIRRSQVVCAIDDYLNFYDNTFEMVEHTNFHELYQIFDSNFNHYPKLTWQQGIELKAIENNYLSLFYDENSPDYTQGKEWFSQVTQNARSIHHLDSPFDGTEFYYMIENDRVWVGG